MITIIENIKRIVVNIMHSICFGESSKFLRCRCRHSNLEKKNYKLVSHSAVCERARVFAVWIYENLAHITGKPTLIRNIIRHTQYRSRTIAQYSTRRHKVNIDIK